MAPSKVMEISLANSLPNFNGDEDDNVNFFFEQIDSLASLEKWSDTKKLIVAKLLCKGKALAFIANDSSAKKVNNYSQLKKVLSEKFTKTKSFSEMQKEFSLIVQKQDQTVKNLAEEVEKITDEYLSINNSDSTELEELSKKIKLNKFLEALRPDIRIDVKKFNPKSFDVAIKHAINIENAICDPECSVNNIIGNDITELLNSQIETNAKIQELSEKLNRLTVNNCQEKKISGKSNNSEDSELIKCQICNKNHLTVNCWHLKDVRQARKQMQNKNQNQNRVHKRYNRGNFRRQANFRNNNSNQSLN